MTLALLDGKIRLVMLQFSSFNIDLNQFELLFVHLLFFEHNQMVMRNRKLFLYQIQILTIFYHLIFELIF